MSWKRIAILVILLPAVLFLSGCAGLMEGFFMSEREAHEEVLRIRENPNLLLEKGEQERWAENARDIERQNRKDDAAREKIINDLLEKQLQNQRDSKR